MSEWYYADAQRHRHGPVAAEEIREKFQQGELGLEGLVWREGMAEWQPLSKVIDELELKIAAEPGIDVRADYSAIENNEPASVSTYSAPESPYAAPAAPLLSDSTGVVSGGEIVYAGFWKRVAAYFVDSIIVGMVGGIIAMIIGGVLGLAMAGMGGGDGMGVGMIVVQVITQLVSMGITAAYYAGFHASTGKATPGKMAVGIKVVRTNGDRISIARGIGRYFGAMLSALTLCIGFLMAAFTDRKQALHDMICDTLVVDKWAFTDHPEWQQRSLGTATIVILAIFGILVVVCIVAVIALIGLGIAAGSHN